jgi:cellulose synthase (UDP-forming)
MEVMSWSPPSPDAATLGADVDVTGLDGRDTPPSTHARATSWSSIFVPEVASSTSRFDARRLRKQADQTLRWAAATSGDIVVFHAGPRPDPERSRVLIAALVDGGHDVCLADDGTNELLSRCWRTLTRHGASTVTVRTHDDPLDPGQDPAEPDRCAPDSGGTTRAQMFAVRRSALTIPPPAPPRPAWQRPSWWMAAVAVAAYAVLGLIRSLGSTTQLETDERAWLTAAQAGSASAYPDGWPGGSSAWPAMMRQVVDRFGVEGVRAASLAFAVVAICCSASAASRFFGRWAARSTAVLVSAVLAVTDAATAASPTMLAAAACSVALLGFALAESSGRASWLLMSGAAAAFAVVVEYQMIVVALAMSPFFLIVRPPSAWKGTVAFVVMWIAATGWWLAPQRWAVGGYVAAARTHLESTVANSGTSTNMSTLALIALVALVAVVLAALLHRVTDLLVRRRILAVTLAGAALLLTRSFVGATVDGGDIATATLLLAPALTGVVIHQITSLARGEEVVPIPRRSPDLLTADPARGRLVGNQVRYTNRQMALAGVLLVVMTAWFVPWAVRHLTWGDWWLSVPFLVANGLVATTALLLSFNNSKRSVPLRVGVAAGHEPLVGVIIPTASEPAAMVAATMESVLDQNWPLDRLCVVISDDGYSEQLRRHVEQRARELPAGVLTYFRPPRRGTKGRIGDSKAGNLNAAMRVVNDAGCEFVETRDADDLVGDPDFLRLTVSQLMLDERIGFVQTIKESTTSHGDPFNNNELLFYRGMMLSRNADYSAFPCGSGLVWRRAALREIGNFPVWNLVEDIHSGVLALRLGWRGLYVPIVGAFAQHAPEDIANYFKQRGTWAIDSIRLFAFDRFRGLPWRTRLHFVEQTAFYLLSLPIMVLLTIPMVGLAVGRFPIDATPVDYAVHFTGFAVAMELIMLAFAADKPLGACVRTRMFLIGMAPLYATAALRALWYGARRKPIYVVTRKTDEHRVYIAMVKAHWILLGFIVLALALSARRGEFLLDLDPGAIYWALVGLTGLGTFVRLSWFGVDLRATIRRRLRLPEAG